jgi:phospholipid-binding lipoprotein MlaA
VIASGTRTRVLRIALSFALCATCACASTGKLGRPERNLDPWEKMNRGTFAFNEGVDKWVLAPVGRAWDYVAPRAVQRGIQNVSATLWMPAVIGNHILQARPRDAFCEDLPRLVVNATVGVAGIFDVASRLGIEENYTDFGISMGRWGLPPGPYVVIPLLGPSSVRGVVGRAGDAFSTPITYFFPWYLFVTARTVELMNLRSLYLEEIEKAKDEAFDYYVFIRDAWTQNRAFYVREARGEPSDDPFAEEDLYSFDDEETDAESPESVDEDVDRDGANGTER